MEGRCKGAIFRGNIEYVIKKHGKLGLQQIKDDMKSKSFHLDLENMKDGHWYPLDSRMRFLKSTAKAFDLDDEKLIELGRSGFNKSTIAQFYLKLAGSPKMIFDISSKVWSHNYDTGRLEPEFNGPQGSYFRIFDFDAEQIFFIYLIGYYMAAFEKVNARNVDIQYKKVQRDGQDCHEYLIKWE